jgi:hypothetical protein
MYKTLVENQTNKPIFILCSNNEGEFSFNQFNKK